MPITRGKTAAWLETKKERPSLEECEEHRGKLSADTVRAMLSPRLNRSMTSALSLHDGRQIWRNHSGRQGTSWPGLAIVTEGEVMGEGVVTTRNFRKGTIVCDYVGRHVINDLSC